jgi:hypothetical protein
MGPYYEETTTRHLAGQAQHTERPSTHVTCVVEEPEILCFFYGRLAPIGDWQHVLVTQFQADFPDSLEGAPPGVARARFCPRITL